MNKAQAFILGIWRALTAKRLSLPYWRGYRDGMIDGRKLRKSGRIW